MFKKEVSFQIFKKDSKNKKYLNLKIKFQKDSANAQLALHLRTRSTNKKPKKREPPKTVTSSAYSSDGTDDRDEDYSEETEEPAPKKLKVFKSDFRRPRRRTRR
jgi:hypothetical protein